ncbi:MAG TPA: PqqD family protein [Acidimicrobiales bacterium]|nr:PqqD family protein [Acidimicrobiales bacterium]
MTPSRRLRQEGVLWQEVASQIVVLDAGRSVYLAVNETGTLLWHALAQGCTTDRLAGILVEEFGIDPDQAAADVAWFVADLDQRGLLENSPS